MPAPLGPIRPMRSLRKMRVEKFSMITRSPQRLEMLRAVMASAPDCSADPTSMVARPIGPICCRRCLRSVVELRAGGPRCGCAGRGCSCPPIRSRARSAGRACAAPSPRVRGSRSTSPRMRHSPCRAGARCRGRATARRATGWRGSAGRGSPARRRPSRPTASSSSHSMVGRSRWLVGSSSSSTSGSATSARASAARRASPPDSPDGSRAPSSFISASSAATR